MNDTLDISFRKDTDDDRWVIPEVMGFDMYRVKTHFAHIEPRKPTYIIDCGAHIGAFSIMCVHHLRNTEIIAFEPNPESFKYLSENAIKFGRINALNKAVAISNGTLDLYSPDEAEWSGRWSTLPNSNSYLTVEAVDLFAFIQQLDKDVFILKLDIEGYEECLIDAVQPGDLNRVQSIIVETHTEKFDHQKLLDLGYKLLFNPEISSARQFVYSR